MPRRLFVLLLFLTLALAACKSTSQTGTVTAEASDTPKATAGPTTAPKQASHPQPARAALGAWLYGDQLHSYP